MRKISSLPAILLAVLCFAASCEKSVENNDGSAAAVEIKSVVWTLDSLATTVGGKPHTDYTYTLWLSPTEDLTDKEGMILADDYVCASITGSSRPAGDFALSSKTVSLSYGALTVDASTFDNYSVAELYVNLQSDNVVDFRATVTPNSGEGAFSVNYHGFCHKWPEAVSAKGQRITLDRVPFFYYAGPTKADSTVTEYYLLLSSADVTGDSAAEASLTGEGYLLCIDLYATPDPEDKKHLPSGVYSRASAAADHVWTTGNSMIEHYDASLARTSFQLGQSDIELTEDSEGVYSFKVAFQNSDYTVDTLCFSGALPSPKDLTLPQYSLPQYEGDVNFTGVKATGIYMGNMLQGAAGMMEIVVYDQNYLDDKVGGQGVILIVFADLFTNSREIRVMPGDYKMKTDFTYMSWMPATEVSYSGSVFALGTYGMVNDGSRNGLYSYAKSGSISISEVTDGYHVEWDLVSGYGYSIKGEYTGSIPVEDQSDDDTKDDGTSTLEKDYELDLSSIESAKLTVDDNIFVIGYGTFKPVSDYYCGHQFIDLGGFSGNGPEGDAVRLELLTKPGEEYQVNVGKYEITPERHPAYFIPGWAVKGSFYEYGDLNGTTFKHYYGGQGESGKWYYYMDAHAAFYTGAITISEADGGQYHISIETYDVRGHKITGEWTGPIELPEKQN